MKKESYNRFENTPEGSMGKSYTPTGSMVYQEIRDTKQEGEEYQPPRGQRLLSGCLASFRYIAVIFALSIMAATFAISFSNDIFAFVKGSEEYTIHLTGEETTSEVAEELRDNDIIRYPFLFCLFMRATGDGAALVPGDYTLSAKMDYRAISKLFTTAEVTRESVDVVIPEGYTQDEIFTLLDEMGVCSKEELLEAAANYDFRYSWVRALPKGEKRLEGYLFPDTYTFYIDDTASRVIGKFLAAFNKKYDVDFKARKTELESSLEDIIIIASMIEAEAKTDEDRPLISSVIYNRMASSRFNFLQIDATVLYAIGEHKTELTENDLAYDSPYNTYVHEGLPVGAICNPGYESIQAALYPEETNYLYYVATPSGSHIFSETLEEHKAACKRAEALYEEAQSEDEEE